MITDESYEEYLARMRTGAYGNGILDRTEWEYQLSREPLMRCWGHWTEDCHALFPGSLNDPRHLASTGVTAAVPVADLPVASAGLPLIVVLGAAVVLWMVLK